MLHMPQVDLIQKASCGYYWEAIRASSSSCLILKHTKLTGTDQAFPEHLKPEIVLNNTGENWSVYSSKMRRSSPALTQHIKMTQECDNRGESRRYAASTRISGQQPANQNISNKYLQILTRERGLLLDVVKGRDVEG